MTQKADSADPDLHGNHDTCPACEMRREALGAVPIEKGEVPCNVCNGAGWLTLPDAEICRRTVEEARRHYWPKQSYLLADPNARGRGGRT
jgi:hypothetical protein